MQKKIQVKVEGEWVEVDCFDDKQERIYLSDDGFKCVEDIRLVNESECEFKNGSKIKFGEVNEADKYRGKSECDHKPIHACSNCIDEKLKPKKIEKIGRRFPCSEAEDDIYDKLDELVDHINK